MKLSANAQASMAAVLNKSETDAYSDELLATMVVKPDGHERPRTALFHGQLFSVTTIARSAKYGGTRTVCVCDDFARAKEIVETNEGDIWECSYMLVVIEEFRANALYGGLGGKRTYWYRWNLEEKRYEPIETPASYENTVGFGVG